LRKELEAQIADLGLTSVVTLMGALPHAGLVPVYRRASVFALAPQVTADGDRDGIPNVLAEAMAVGVPVVSAAISGIPELVEDGQTGLLVKPEDPPALADAVERLLRDPTLRRALAVAARRRIEDRFECWETAKALRALFSTVRIR
jgi:glycosyltransferase involved in cell wall biosynthesis